jgi:hypothetical protein
MSVKSTNAAHGATSGAFSLNVADKLYWTLEGWLYFDGPIAGGDDMVATVYNSSGSPFAHMMITSANKLALYDGAFSATGSGGDIPSGAWFQVAMRYQRPGGAGDKTLDVGMWRSGDANWAVTNTLTNNWNNDQTPGSIRLGWPENTAGVLARYAYWQFYSGGSTNDSGAYRSVADLNAQRASTSLHAAYSSGFREQWKLTTNDGNLWNGDIGVNLTNSSMTFDASNPTLSSSAPIAALARHYAMLRAAS